MRLLLSLYLPDNVAHIPMLRRVSREALASCKVGPSDLDDLELLIGELATNAARHARAAHYRVDIELYDGFAVITVADTGTGFERETVPPPGALRADHSYGDADDAAPVGAERFGGWGLPLVETLADRVEYLPANPRGTVVRAHKRVCTAAPC